MAKTMKEIVQVVILSYLLFTIKFISYSFREMLLLFVHLRRTVEEIQMEIYTIAVSITLVHLSCMLCLTPIKFIQDT